ncbi:hypothetical protein PHLGIDRAFT_189081 [Phlebiopsis gigantea 11061_1 CR5-6]|uniref:Uncharacterized protein n=1 Tax=Phlebiopsis gigantea (strain 11061_1 CR5-6) TaxID=745531 RepID=A0A0C3PG15_PHLG1|nr:hypothetical protein PHLGIDRAFT_189081 [Phlebiopsis gigantea 11061_1 CR5-6]
MRVSPCGSPSAWGTHICVCAPATGGTASREVEVHGIRKSASACNCDVPLAAGDILRSPFFSHFQRSLGRRGGGGRCTTRPCRATPQSSPRRGSCLVNRSSLRRLSSPRAQRTCGHPRSVEIAEIQAGNRRSKQHTAA